MKCTKCGHKLRVGDEFCSKCGTQVEPDIVYYEKDFKYSYSDDRNRQNYEHDITGEIDFDLEDSASKKASKWTSKGIAAAIGIAAAFVIAIIALNIHNMIKSNEAPEMGEVEAQTTTTREMTTEAPTEELTEATDEESSWFKNPFKDLFNSESSDNNDYGSSSDYYDEDTHGGIDRHNYGKDISDFLNDVGGSLRDTIDDYGNRIFGN